MTRTLVVSIINFRTGPMTIDCVKSVLADIEDIDAEVVVVDNLSGDGSAEEIAAWIDTQPADCPVRLVQSETNSGFSGGHNQGMGAVEADYYLVLNSDAIIRPGFCAAILAAAGQASDTGSKVGFTVPRIEYEDGTAQINCFRFPGMASEFMRGANSGPVTRLLKSHEVALGTDPDPAEIDWASFACILLSGEMVRTLGPMDEGYFMYFEDAEYFLRGGRAGWGLRRAPEAVAVHYRGGSGPVKEHARQRKRLPAYYYSSRTRFLYQAHGRTGLWLANLAWASGRVIAGLRRLGGRPSDNMRAGEPRDIWTNVLSPLGPRYAPDDPS